MLAYLMMTLLLLVSMLLIFIVLLQRGRGGGLAGALGGMGGQSAFGTKAGDVFTRITVILAIVWIVLCAGSIPLLRYLSGGRYVGGSDTPQQLVAPRLPDGEKKKEADDASGAKSSDAAGESKSEPDSKGDEKLDLKFDLDADAVKPSSDEKRATPAPGEAKEPAEASPEK